MNDKLEHILTVQLEKALQTPIARAARQDGRSISSYVRGLILTDLRNRSLIDEDNQPVMTSSLASGS